MTIRTRMTTLFSASLLALSVAALSGCQKQEPAPVSGAGPAEQAGRQLDQAAAKTSRDLSQAAEQARQDMSKVTAETKEKLDQAGTNASNSLSNATAKVGAKLERAGEKMQESANEAKKN